MRLSLRISIVFALAIFLVFPFVSSAQPALEPPPTEKELRSIKKARCAKKTFRQIASDKECLTIWLEDEAAANDKVSLSFTLNAAGDETDSDEQYKLDTALELSKGTYPQQFSFVTKAGIRLDDDELEENVSELRVTFDRYLTPRLEGWLFAVRTTDSFMSIEQRYEVGLGLDAEWWVGLGELGKRSVCRDLERTGLPNLTAKQTPSYELKPAKAELDPTKLMSRGGRPLLPAGETNYLRSLEAFTRLEVEQAISKMDAAADKRTAAREDPGKISGFDAEFVELYCDNRRGLLKRRAALILSLGAEVFAEFEQPEPLMAFVHRRGEDGTLVEAAERSEVPLPADQRLRWALRPSVTWRPSEHLSFRSRIYFKFPLDSPREIDGEEDTRLDGEFQMKYAITESGKGALSLDITYRHDEIPPAIDLEHARVHLGDDIEIAEVVEAESSHWIFKLGFTFGLM